MSSKIIVTPVIFVRETDAKIYISRLKNVFEANSFTDEQMKKTALPSLISVEVYTIFNSLCLPKDPKREVIRVIIVHVTRIYEPKKSYLVRTVTNCIPLAKALKKLRDLDTKCNFKPKVELVVHDAFLVGIGPGRIWKQLFEENASNLAFTLNMLMGVVISKETNINVSKQWSGKTDSQFNLTSLNLPLKQSTSHSIVSSGRIMVIICMPLTDPKGLRMC